jgi:hypothetical protein
MAELNFDPTSVPMDETSPFTPIEPGEYQMQVIESELKQTKSGTGTLLKLTLEILGPTYANRRIFDNLNIQNPNEQAERISLSSLADLCALLGFNSVVRDSTELHYKPFTAKVSIQPDKTGQWGPQNRVHYPRRKNGETTPFPAAAPRAAAAAPAQRPASPARPWASPKPRI